MGSVPLLSHERHKFGLALCIFYHLTNLMPLYDCHLVYITKEKHSLVNFTATATYFRNNLEHGRQVRLLAVIAIIALLSNEGTLRGDMGGIP